MRLIVEKWILSELYATQQQQQQNDVKKEEESKNIKNTEDQVIKYELQQIEQKVEELYSKRKCVKNDVSN